MVDIQRNAESESYWQDKAKDMLAIQPSAPFKEVAKQLMDANHGFHQAMAKELAAPLNAYLKSINNAPTEAKKPAIDELRDLFNTLGISVRCPKTGVASLLYAVSPSDSRPQVQFWFKPKNSRATTITTVNLESVLPLELVESAPRMEGFAWRHRVKDDGDRDTGPQK